jgi:succinate dehydrogenase / fumarate reductase cytochrome b subunit
MGLNSERNVDLLTALRYNGKGPMLAYLLHRIAGVGLFIFFTTYILALVGVSFINVLYQNWLFQIIVIFCALFHAINGLRITILDLWPQWQVYQRQAIRIEWMVFWPLYIFAVIVVIRNAMGG